MAILDVQHAAPIFPLLFGFGDVRVRTRARPVAAAYVVAFIPTVALQGEGF